MKYKKVQCSSGGKFPVVRYIDNQGNWIKEMFNGHIEKSKPMSIIKDCGEVELNIINEGVFGLRLSTT